MSTKLSSKRRLLQLLAAEVRVRRGGRRLPRRFSVLSVDVVVVVVEFSSSSWRSAITLLLLLLKARALPENPKLPSVSAFAECQTTGTRQRCCLPSARPRALGKKLAHGMPGLYRVTAVGKAGHSAKCLLCRVMSQRHSAKPAHVPSTRARRATPVGGADGVKSLPSATTWHSAKGIFCRVPRAWLSANFLLPSAGA